MDLRQSSGVGNDRNPLRDWKRGFVEGASGIGIVGSQWLVVGLVLVGSILVRPVVGYPDGYSHVGSQ